MGWGKLDFWSSFRCLRQHGTFRSLFFLLIMKNLILIALFVSLSAFGQGTITYTTNIAYATISVAAPNTLLANGQRITPTFSTVDFSNNSGFITLAPSIPRTTSTNLTLFTVPSNTWSAAQGTVYFDTNYLYVATGTNKWKRINFITNTW